MILCRAELARRIDKAVFPFSQGGPMMHAIAGKAVALREAGRSRFQWYARQTVDNARALAAGLAAEGMRPVTGGTDNHLVLADLRELGVTGCDAEMRCERAGITLGKHALPYDPERAAVTSGVRLGAPAVTTQGMGTVEMGHIAELIGAAVRADPATARGAHVLRDLAEQSRALSDRFPAYRREAAYA
jgi:glycine hydroxymethyltransferase